MNLHPAITTAASLSLCLARWPSDARTPFAMRRTRVFLSTRHLDRDPTDNTATNLAAPCKRCHLLDDAPEHGRRHAMTVLARRAC